MDGPAALIGWATGMPISPHFDAPYLSASVSEFWSKRWNLTVGNTLRFLCYDPVHEGKLPEGLLGPSGMVRDPSIVLVLHQEDRG